MIFNNDQSDATVLQELGQRIAQYRLNRNKTQAALAREAGISHRTVTRVEQGESVQAASLIRILRALELLPNLDALVPEPPVSPVQRVKMQGKQRQRASSKSAAPKQPAPWTWDDDA